MAYNRSAAREAAVERDVERDREEREEQLRDELAPEYQREEEEEEREIAEVRDELVREDHERGHWEKVQEESWKYGWLGDPVPEVAEVWSETPERLAEQQREEDREIVEREREAEVERLWERYPEEMRAQEREDAEHAAHVREIFGMSDREYAEYDAERTREIERETPELFDPDDPRAYL